jgi:hypothetical protein
MGDKVVTEDLLKDAMNGLVSKDKFQSDIDRLIASVTDVNKTVATLSTKLDEHMRKTELDESFRLEQSRLNTKIDNVQTQLLEKQGLFDGKSSSSSGGGEPYGLPPPPVHKLRFSKYDGTEDPLGWLHKCEQFFSLPGYATGAARLDSGLLPQRRREPVVFSLGEEPGRAVLAGLRRRRQQALQPPNAEQPPRRAYASTLLGHRRRISRELPDIAGALRQHQREATDSDLLRRPSPQMGIDVDLHKPATLDDAMSWHGLSSAAWR